MQELRIRCKQLTSIGSSTSNTREPMLARLDSVATPGLSESSRLGTVETGGVEIRLKRKLTVLVAA